MFFKEKKRKSYVFICKNKIYTLPLQCKTKYKGY